MVFGLVSAGVNAWAREKQGYERPPPRLAISSRSRAARSYSSAATASASCSASVLPTRYSCRNDSFMALELADQFVLVELFLGAELGEHFPHLLQSPIDGFDGRLRAGFLELQHGGRLDAVEEHERTVLLVGERPLRVGRMGRHEVHQRQGVIGVGHRPGELPQRQAANPPVIELQELAVDLHALRLR